MIPEPKRLYRLRLYHVEDVLKLHAGPCPSFPIGSGGIRRKDWMRFIVDTHLLLHLTWLC